jgi:hypothetical protein
MLMCKVKYHCYHVNVHIRHLLMKIKTLSCHRCLIYSGGKKMNSIKSNFRGQFCIKLVCFEARIIFKRTRQVQNQTYRGAR